MGGVRFGEPPNPPGGKGIGGGGPPGNPPPGGMPIWGIGPLGGNGAR